jgi:hypothetical protein
MFNALSKNRTCKAVGGPFVLFGTRKNFRSPKMKILGFKLKI